ncbi:hypothetical protein, partial [Pseudomonas sp. 2995-3]|uniref:hypothetical protein n=1 Tax=Pseudomonas sp. 2995-3 TaxID=1712680 RepID=UPI001C43A467
VEVVIEDAELSTTTDPTSEVFYTNNKLFIVKTVRDNNILTKSLNSNARPINFILIVYEKGELIYKGEIVSDINDDIIQFINEPIDRYTLPND